MRSPSIGLKWTLRYTAAMMLLLVGMGFAYDKLVEAQVRRDAYLLLELQANELVEAVRRQGEPARLAPELEDYIDQSMQSAQGDLRMGIRILDREGRPLLERGVFRQRAIPVPEAFEQLAAERRLVEVDLGDSFPYAVYVASLPYGYAEIAISTRRFLRGIRDIRNIFLQALPVALLLTGLLGWWLARGSLSPIARMTEASRRITASQLDEEIPRSGTGDELDALAQTLNAMMERVRAGVERIHSFSSTAAHQLRTPLSRLQSRLEMAGAAPREARADQALIDRALRDVERLSAVVKGMLRLSDSEGGLRPEQRQPVLLAPLLEEVAAFFEPVAAEKHIKLRVQASGDATVIGDREWLNELFSNLLDNALRYAPAGGAVDVVMRIVPPRVAVSVRDDGPGIPADRQRAIFERFQRGPGSEGSPGVGLGLTVAREIALAHGGAIEVESSPGLGARFTTWLPTAEALAHAERAT